MTITDSTFRDTDTVSPGNNGLLIQADGSATSRPTSPRSSFLRNRANGVQVINNGSGTVDVEIGTTAANGAAPSRITTSGSTSPITGSGTLPFDVLNASFYGAHPGQRRLAHQPQQGDGRHGHDERHGIGQRHHQREFCDRPRDPRHRQRSGGTLTTLIQSNNISQVANRGIEVIARDGSNTLNATITNNVVTLTNALSADGIRVDAGAIGTDTTTICADITGNTSTTVAGVFGVRVRQRFAGTTFRLEDYAGAPTNDAAVATFLSTNNNGATTSADHAGAGFGTIVDCPTP